MGHSSHHREDSSSSKSHRPIQPSSLRQSHPASSRDSSQESGPAFRHAVPSGEENTAQGETSIGRNANESTPLIPDGGGAQRRRSSAVHPGVCNHGTFSPRPTTPDEAFPFTFTRDDAVAAGPGEFLDNSSSQESTEEGWKRWFSGRIRTRRMGQTRELAHQAGLRDMPLMYLSYYIPCLNWMQQYKWAYFKGDLVSAVTIASFYLPMALSLASNLAHVPPIHGLYAFVFNPLIYALLGSSSQMVVGPEAAGSLLVGTVVQQSVDSGGSAEDNDLVHAQICGVVAGMAGATVLIAGIARLGFLDSVLSRPFLRGFISAIGFVIAVDQLIPELGLNNLASQEGASHGSTFEKIAFIIENIGEAHHLTFAVAGISFLVIMIFREVKKSLEPKFPSAVFIPDRFLVVVVSAILCWHLRWDQQGVEVLGSVKAANGGVFAFRWPFQLSHMKHIRTAMSTSFLIALLGFFESSVAAKSLGGNDAIQGIELSANREMIALGAANLVGACFMSLPAFGGYGRSKVNKTTGGKSPKPVLCSMISVVACSLIEEAPHDIAFFITIRGWTELGLMAVIFLATIFYSLTLGMALGVGISILLVIKHSTRSRIQILGRIPGTNRFENAESGHACLEFIEGCLIVKIPEPLTFANTGELKARLRRLELYGTSKVHPALPRLRSQESNRNIIFDIHGVTSMDGSGTQVLEEIVRSYRERGVRIFFSRCPSPRDRAVWKLLESSGIVALSGGESHFVNDVEEALRWTEYEESIGVRSGNSV
ncbi:sulfate transporter [Metarhizium album ARSEF 1941]|uniref:Sulfate transporter n=1 Tax=Metarhizium album (strain ARSEF 1941) TaxID=1081103 RepID=A0A0B2WNK2_METAS|nr:sulfate transporter [Metarhizium album ARSEF 1941]KHN95067.1 sulfate transporter [Metarhizium album ARSEF 1941]